MTYLSLRYLAVSALVGTSVILEDGAVRAQESKKLELREFAPEKGMFKSLFPGKPEYAAKEVEPGITEHKYSIVAGGKRFVVSYFDLPEIDYKGKDPKKFLAAFAAGSRKGAKFAGERDVLLGKNKIPARAYWLETPGKIFIRERIALSGGRLFTQFVSAREEDLIFTADTDKFFDAFEIVKADQPAPPAKLEFSEFAPEGGKFKGIFPGKPDHRTEDWGGNTAHEYSVIAGNSRYFVTYVDLNEADIKGKDPHKGLAAFAEGYRKKAPLEDKLELTLGPAKLPAFSYTLEVPEKILIRERLALSGHRLFIQALATLEGKEFLSSADANKFFDALEISQEPK